MSSGDGSLAPTTTNNNNNSSSKGSSAAAAGDNEESAARTAATRAREAVLQASPSMPRISRSSMDLPRSPALSERDYSDGLFCSTHTAQHTAAPKRQTRRAGERKKREKRKRKQTTTFNDFAGRMNRIDRCDVGRGR